MIDYSQALVGERIRLYRLTKGLSLKQLEKLTGISAGYLGDLERGGKTKGSSVSMKNICKIAEVLDVSLDDLAYTNIEFRNSQSNNPLIADFEKEIESMSWDDLNILNNAIDIFISK